MEQLINTLFEIFLIVITSGLIVASVVFSVYLFIHFVIKPFKEDSKVQTDTDQNYLISQMNHYRDECNRLLLYNADLKYELLDASNTVNDLISTIDEDEV